MGRLHAEFDDLGHLLPLCEVWASSTNPNSHGIVLARTASSAMARKRARSGTLRTPPGKTARHGLRLIASLGRLSSVRRMPRRRRPTTRR